ncbi:MAG TPA: tripartite tricarboxylate transporter substrate binding protein, partial [Burkholderiales bacterium]|nr:tripartite tricarboxylate transporter substrate binding protein [Burkholderiales bacterium]
PAGSSVDISARYLAGKLGERLYQNVVVDNRSGAGGSIAVELVARAKPDGYTLLLAAPGALTINPHLQRNLAYDTLRDFAPVVRVVNSTFVLTVSSTLPAKSVEELVALAKAKPLLAGSAGIATPGHLSLALFNSMAGTRVEHVAYKGSVAALVDLIGGAIHFSFAPSATAVPHIKSGKLTGIAVTNSKRSALVPELRTMAEAGFKGFAVDSWYGLLTTAGTPRTVVHRLNGDIVKVLSTSDVQQFLLAQGLEASPGTPEEFGAQLKSEISKWGRVVQESGIRIE